MSCCCNALTGKVIRKPRDPDQLPPNLIVPIENVTPWSCGFERNDGRDAPEAFVIDVSGLVGIMEFHYMTYTQRDRFRLYMDTQMFFDTGCVGNGGVWTNKENETKKTFYVPKNAKRLWIEAIPNCIHDIPAPSNAPASTLVSKDRGTVWNIKTVCPNGKQVVDDKKLLKAYRTTPELIDSLFRDLVLNNN